MQPRPYQSKAHQGIKDGIGTGVYHQLIQAATGTGKTVIFAGLPEQLKATHPGKMLVLAHREELIDQAIKKMQKVNPTLRIDKEMGSDHIADPEAADVIVASVATLGRVGSKRILGYDWSKFDKFVVDEAHHALASTYTNIFEAAGLLQIDDKRLLLGVTATPQRGDGQALAKLFQKIVFSYPMRQAIEDGWLVDVRGFKVSTGVSLDGVKVSQGDYDQTQLSNTVNTPQRNQLIVKSWLDHAEGRQTIGFTVDIQHAKDLAAMFRHHGIKAEAIWGDDPDRAWKLARHQGIDAMIQFTLDNGLPGFSIEELQELRITVILNAALLIEGYDDWRIGCVILGGPTKSPVKFTQEVGRGTRLEELPDGTTPNLNEWKAKHLKETLEGGDLKPLFPATPIKFPFKTDCIVIDVVDASNRNSLITLPTLMGLSAGLNLNGRGLLAAVNEIEEVQKEYPHIDFTQLADISTLDAYIESVNLFEIKFPAEVESNSELTWYPSPTGGYNLMLPNKERLSITQNILDKWEITGTIKGKSAKGERPSLEQAFSAADTVISNHYAEALKVLRREETWHKDAASPAQLKLLKKFFKGKAIPNDLSKGSASKLISSYMANKE